MLNVSGCFVQLWINQLSLLLIRKHVWCKNSAMITPLSSFKEKSNLYENLLIHHFYRIDKSQNHHYQIVNLLHCLYINVNERKSPKSTTLMWFASCLYSFLILLILVCIKKFSNSGSMFSIRWIIACMFGMLW